MPNRLSLPEPQRWKTVVIPACLAVLLLGALAALLLALAVREADDLVTKRDRDLAASIFRQAIERIAHDQESVTAWDEAVLHMHDPVDPNWLDDNMGIWMNMYFGHERTVLLNAHDRPVYASVGSSRVDPSAFLAIADVAAPMIADVRRVLTTGAWQSPNPGVRSPGMEDVVVVDGHPAMVSVKPVVPSTDKVKQDPRDAFIHISIHYLDGAFLNELRQRYLFEGARFAWFGGREVSELSFPVTNNVGRQVGFLIWKAHLPGRLLAERMMPALALTLVAVLIVVSMLAASLRKGARALRESEARARHLAYHDVLTGLANRASFNERLSALYASRSPDVGLLLLDLDRFKQVNDTFGHPVGDELIKAVAARLRIAVHPHGIVARLGGDEFAVIVANTSWQDLSAMGTSIADAIKQPFRIGDCQMGVGVSIGIATSRDCVTEEVLIKEADQALYRVKGSGRVLGGDGGQGFHKPPPSAQAA